MELNFTEKEQKDIHQKILDRIDYSFITQLKREIKMHLNTDELKNMIKEEVKAQLGLRDEDENKK